MFPITTYLARENIFEDDKQKEYLFQLGLRSSYGEHNLKRLSEGIFEGKH